MNRKFKALTLFLTVFFTLTLIISMGTDYQASAAGKKYVKIGTIMPITGPLAVLGLAFNRGWQLYADKTNDAGGLKIGNDTYMFKLISEDSKMSPEAASTAAKKLISQDKVDYLIGGIVEFELEAIQQVAASKKVPFIVANINFPGHRADVSSKKPLVVRLCISHDDTHSMDFNYLVKTYPKAKRLALVAGDDGYENMLKELTAETKKRGIDVVGVELWPLGLTDFIPIYTKVLSSKPDIVWSVVSAQSTYQLMAARQLGFRGPFVSNSPLGPEVFQRVVNDPNSLSDVITNGADLSKPTESMKEVMARWQKNYKDPFISDSIAAWDQLWILTQAIQKAGSIEGGKVISALERMTKPGSLETCFGPGRMGGKEKYGVNRVLIRPIPITRLMKGKPEFLGFQATE